MRFLACSYSLLQCIDLGFHLCLVRFQLRDMLVQVGRSIVAVSTEPMQREGGDGSPLGDGNIGASDVKPLETAFTF